MKRRDSVTPPPSEALSIKRVLIVEDDPVLGMSTEDTLRSAGVEHIDICPTTDGAMEVLRTTKPDAVILDVHLSDRSDGWAIAELIETLGENGPKIIFSTGSPQDIPPAIAELGSVLEKPYAPEALIAALREPGRSGILSRLRGALS